MTINRKRIIGDNLFNLRNAARLERMELVKLTDIPYPVIESIEWGDIFPTFEMLEKLCVTLNCSYLKLLFKAEEIES